MARKARKMTIAYADFETEHVLDLRARGQDPYIKGNEVFIDDEDGMPVHPEIGIKCFGIIVVPADGSDAEEITGSSIPEFLQVLVEKKVNRCYFHNLRFDDSFIASWMKDDAHEIAGWRCQSIERIINEMGVVYSDKIGYVKGSKTHVCDLWDSMKIWNTPLRKLGKDFGVLKMGTGSEEALRVGCDERMLEYCIQDCRVVRAAMEYYFDQCNIASGGEKPYGWMTAASTSYGLCMMDLRARMKVDGLRRHYPDASPENGFPEWLREGYKGAVPLLDPAIKGQVLEDVKVFDVNSQYPDKLRNYPMPFGLPVDLTGADFARLLRIKSRGALWIAKVRMVMDVKPGHRATYMLKHRGEDGNTLAAHVNDLTGMNECDYQVITSADLDYILRDYDIRFAEVIEAIGFYADVKRTDRFFGNEISGHVLAPFIDRWYEIKDKAGQAGNKALKAFAKLILNSLYGKFGANPEHEVAGYDFVEGNMIRLKVRDETEIDEHPLYLPVAMFVTAYARDVISRTCNAIGWEHVAYTDTDSVHVHGLDEDEIVRRINAAGYAVDPDELGAYDYESRWAEACYVRNKGYFHFGGLDPKTGAANGESEIKMAGVNDTSAFKKISDILGKVIDGIQRRAYRVKGGTLIMEKPVEIDCRPESVNDPDLVRVVKYKGRSKAKSAELYRALADKRRLEYGT